MSPQAQTVSFPGYSIVYPDGITGLKIVGAFTQAPRKIINQDGSAEYTIPAPTIYELFGGGFAYADGSKVTDRTHLERISDSKMKERALAWFDGNGKISEKATEGVPILDPESKKIPETLFVLSSELPEEKDEVTADIKEHVRKVEHGSGVDPMLQVLDGIKNLTSLVKAQDERIGKLEANTNPYKEARKSQSEKMKAKWADPEYRAKHIGNIGRKKNGNNAPETDKEV